MNKYPKFHNKKILVGDYDNTSFRYTNMILSSLGFIVDNVETPEEVKEAVLNNKYDLIITNNVYRHGTGELLLRDLKEIDNFNTPVVIHSISDEYEFKYSGFDGYLKKPIDKQDVIDLFSKLLK